MKTLAILVLGALLLAFQQQLSRDQQAAPDWAYGYQRSLRPGDVVAPPCPETARPFPDCAYAATLPPQDGIKHTLPGAAASFTRVEAYYDFGPADWYPEDHPPMPDIVAHGRESAGIRACALCHFPNGQGKMENGGVAGLSAAYILQQIEAFRSGARRSADPRKANAKEMAQVARLLTDDEKHAAAEYFASLRWRPWVKVVETDVVPAVRATTNGLFMPLTDRPPMALGARIIEVPQRPRDTDELRDPRAGFLAYVPRGSVAKGAALVSTGGGKTLPCGSCHGADLRGVGDIPGIAGRTASYLVRQLWDMKQGARQSPVMAPVVARLEVSDLINLAAFVASREP